MSGTSTPQAGPSAPGTGIATPASEHDAIQAVLQALNSLYTNPDNQAKMSANTWLQGFQKMVRQILIVAHLS